MMGVVAELSIAGRGHFFPNKPHEGISITPVQEKLVPEVRTQAGSFDFINSRDGERVEWHPSEAQLYRIATMHHHILNDDMTDAEFAASVLPLHEAYRNADDLSSEMNRTDTLGRGNCFTPNTHILSVVQQLRTDHIRTFYPPDVAKSYVASLRLAALHHDDGKILGATNGNHYDVSIQTFTAMVHAVSDLGACMYPSEIAQITIKLIRTHHAYQDFPKLIYSEPLAKLQKSLIDTMRDEVNASETGTFGQSVRTRHHTLLIMLLRDEVNKALNLQAWLERYPEFADPAFVHIALALNEADLLASECLQFLITVNRIVVEQLLNPEVVNSPATHFFPPYH